MGHFPTMEEALELTEAERELLEKGHARQAETVHEARVLSAIYTARHLRQAAGVVDEASASLQRVIQESTQDVIESNAELAEKSHEYAGALKNATWVLAGATVALFLVTLVQLVLPFVR